MRFFITSERESEEHELRYTVRTWDADMHRIENAGPLQEHATFDEAKRHARMAANFESEAQ